MDDYFPSHLKLCTLDMSESVRNFMIWRFIELVSLALNFTYELVPSKDGYLGARLPDGNVSGIFGMLEHGECDISLDMFAITEARRDAADFSYPYHFTDITFMTHKPRVVARSFAIFYPFSAGVWITLVAFLFIKSLVFTAVLKRRNFQYVLVTLFGNLMHEPLNYNFKKSSSKLLMFSWITGVFFVTVSYQAVLLSSLTIPSYVGIRNRDELREAVATGSVECITRKGSFLINYFMHSQEESVRAVGRCLEKNSAKDVDVEEFLDSHPDGGVYITARTLVRPLEVKYFLPGDFYFPVIVGVAYPKWFTHRRPIDKVVKKINEAYLYEKIVDDVVFNSSLKKYAEAEVSEPNKKILLEDVLGSFAILAVGYALALMALCYEFWKWKRESQS